MTNRISGYVVANGGGSFRVATWSAVDRDAENYPPLGARIEATWTPAPKFKVGDRVLYFGDVGVVDEVAGRASTDNPIYTFRRARDCTLWSVAEEQLTAAPTLENVIERWVINAPKLAQQIREAFPDANL